MHKLFFLIGTLTIFLEIQGQDKYYDNYSVDTLKLTEIHFKKVVSYKIGSVTFLVKYEDYKKELYIYWKRYKEGMKYGKDAKEKGEYVNPEYEPRWKTIDSVYQLLRTQAKTQDTIYLDQIIFDKVGLGALNNFFPDMIEKNKCAIFDNKATRHFTIIRHKGGTKTSNSSGHSGRIYFLPGEKQFFIGVTDSIAG